MLPHTHADRTAIIEQLVPLFYRKFGDNLLAIAADASYARGEDRSYSDLEMVVFLREALPKGAERYLQRIADGMLIEVIYWTVDAYKEMHGQVGPDWPQAASDVLLPVYNAPAIAEVEAWREGLEFPREDFVRAAARRMLMAQESYSKVLNAVEQGNVEGVSLLLFDAVMETIMTMAFLNETPLTTFARYIAEARRFYLKPSGFDALLDLVVYGEYQDLPRVEQVAREVYAGMEALFAQESYRLYDESIDPNLPNKKY